jgi:hypothetical protein
MKRKVSLGDLLELCEKLIPVVTILTAIVAGILGLFSIIHFTISEAVILSVLGLLATTALIERLSILNRIDHTVRYDLPHALGNPTAKDVFKTQFRVLDEPKLREAKTLDISAVSFNYLAVNRRGLLAELLKNGRRVRLLVMDPSAPGIAHPTPADVPNMIKNSMEILSPLKALGKLEIKSCNYSLPFGIVIVDGEKSNGFLVVTIYSYKTYADNRPQIVLRHEDNDHWYGFFTTQFEQMFLDATPWSE